MRKLFSLIFFNLILFMLVNVNIVFATDSAQMQKINQNVEQNVDKSKEVNEMGIYKMPDDLTYSDSSRIYLNNGIILFKYTDGTEQLVDMMSPDIVKNVNFDGDSDNIVISFVYNNVIINGTVLLQKSTDTIMHNTVVGAGAGDSIRGVLEVFYSDGSLGIVKMTDPEVVVEGFDNSVPGIQELIVKYKGFEQKFKVNIIENYNPMMNGKLREDNNVDKRIDNKKAPDFIKIEGSNRNNSFNNFNNNKNNNINRNNQSGPDNTMAKGLLPQTGAIPILVIIIFIFVIILVIIYIRKLYIQRGIRGI